MSHEAHEKSHGVHALVDNSKYPLGHPQTGGPIRDVAQVTQVVKSVQVEHFGLQG